MTAKLRKIFFFFVWNICPDRGYLSYFWARPLIRGMAVRREIPEAKGYRDVTALSRHRGHRGWRSQHSEPEYAEK